MPWRPIQEVYPGATVGITEGTTGGASLDLNDSIVSGASAPDTRMNWSISAPEPANFRFTVIEWVADSTPVPPNTNRLARFAWASPGGVQTQISTDTTGASFQPEQFTANTTDGYVGFRGTDDGVTGDVWNESYQILVEVFDGGGDSLVANDDIEETNKNIPVTTDVLQNDTLNGAPVSVGDLDGIPNLVSGGSKGDATTNLDGSITYYPYQGAVGADSYRYSISAGGMTSSATVHITIHDTEPPKPDTSYNCIECGETRNSDTLQSLRTRMMIRLGHAASANRPPPGMGALLDDFLREAQRFLYEKVASFRQTRFFEWPLEQGVRFYGFNDGDGGCTKMVPELVEGVYVCDGDPAQERWVELAAGIDPRLYTGGVNESWPSRYEFRSCIEVWPAPDSRAGYLRIKAKGELMPFKADEDRTTIDSDLVFMLALANAKSHYGKQDAAQYNGMVQSRIGDLIAAEHHTRRYVPGDDPWQPPSPPLPKDGWL